MTGQYAVAPGCKGALESRCALNPVTEHGSRPSQQISFKALISRTAAMMLVVASAGFGCVYAWQTGSEHGLALAALSVLMALGLELAKPLAVAGAIEALCSWSFVRATALGILGLVAVAYSLTAELSLQAMARGDLVSERAAGSSNAANLNADRERLSRELAEIGTTRPSAAIQADLDALLIDKRLNDCEGWVESPKLRVVCAEKVAPLRSEHAKAERREKLEADLAALRPVAGEIAVKHADPGAHALGTYLQALGISLNADVISEWLVLVPVLALEIGSAFAGLLIRGSQVSTPETTCSTPARANRSKTQETWADAVSVQGVHEGVAKLTVADDPGERLVQLLRDRGGEVLTGQRMLAKALNVSTGAVNALLHDLAEAGRLHVEAGKSGTRVRLAHVAA